jgi:hypothetical protein
VATSLHKEFGESYPRIKIHRDNHEFSKPLKIRTFRLGMANINRRIACCPFKIELIAFQPLPWEDLRALVSYRILGYILPHSNELNSAHKP